MEITIGRVNSHFCPMLVEVITLEALRQERSPASRVVIFIVTLKRSLRSIKHRVKYVVSCYDDRPFFKLMLKHPHNRIIIVFLDNLIRACNDFPILLYTFLKHFLHNLPYLIRVEPEFANKRDGLRDIDCTDDVWRKRWNKTYCD